MRTNSMRTIMSWLELVRRVVDRPLFAVLSRSALPYLFLIPLLLWGTGLASDDFDEIRRAGTRWDWGWLLPSAYLATPVLHYTHVLPYKLFPIEMAWVFDLLKAAYILGAFWAIGRFFRLFFSKETAWFSSFAFLFFPSHDATTYWYLGQYLTLAFSFYALAFVKADEGKLGAAFICAILGSFSSYGSTPIAVGFSLLFLFQRKPWAGFAMIIPNLLYIVYFLTVTIWLGKGPKRIPQTFDPVVLIKQFLLQVGTALDATVGPSLVAKIIVSIGSISLLGIIISMGVTFFFFIQHPSPDGVEKKPRGGALISFGIMVLIALLMFAITGHYPQLAFNLGNRTTIYGAFLAVFLLAAFIQEDRRKRALVLLLLLFSSFGLTEHWRQWNTAQHALIREVGDMEKRGELAGASQLFTVGFRYSNLHGFDHIEGASERSVTNSLLEIATGKNYSPIPLSGAMMVQGGQLFDKKYGISVPLAEQVRVVDLVDMRVEVCSRDQLAERIARIPKDRRHWLQLIDKGPLQSLVLYLMPRLKYAFE